MIYGELVEIASQHTVFIWHVYGILWHVLGGITLYHVFPDLFVSKGMLCSDPRATTTSGNLGNIIIPNLAPGK